MSKLQLIKLSGWAFIAGALAFITILSGSDSLAIPGSLISSILLAAGMLGLRAGYGERVGRLGRNLLPMGVVGSILWCIALALLVPIGLSGNLTLAQLGTNGGWVFIFGGPVLSLLGLTLFGLAALRSRPMPRMNWLPAFTGIWYPAAYFFWAGYLFTHHGKFPQQYYTAIFIIFFVQFLALCALGGFLASDTRTHEKLATA